MVEQNNAFEDAVREYSMNSRSDYLVNAILGRDIAVDEHIKLLIAKAFADNSDMSIILADYYNKGELVIKNEEESVRLYQYAQSIGNPRGALKLGIHYYENNNYINAINCFCDFLQQENNCEDNELGYCYAALGDSYVRLASPDMSKAKENLEIAAEKYNDAYAGYRLGYLCSSRECELFDLNKSIKYYELGAKNGSIPASIELAKKYGFGDEYCGIASNRSKAIELLSRHTSSNNVEIFELLGRIYMNNYDTESPDYSEARAAFGKVLEIDRHYYKAGYIEQFLGYACYMQDDFDDAIEYMTIADSNGYYLYSAVLGSMCSDLLRRNGLYDPNQIMKYYDNAYRSGNINMFHCADYIKFLMDYGNNSDYFSKAYEIAEYGISTYNDVFFYLCKAKLVLMDRVNDGISKREAAQLLEELKGYNTVNQEEYLLLGDYYVSVGDYRIAEQNYLSAYKEGSGTAALTLARLYEDGAGSIKSNVQMAVTWYKRAAEIGNEEAKKELDCFTEKVFGGYKRTRKLQ